MNWFNDPLISPATAFYCFIGLLAIDALYLILRKAMKDTGEPDALEQPHGDVPNVERRG